MALINRNNLPPGGWQFPQTDKSGRTVKDNWENNMSPFSDFVKEVLGLRVANGFARATTDEVADEVDVFTCQRLNNNPQFCFSEKKTAYPARFIRQPIRAIEESVAIAAKAIIKLNEGRKILQEWIGEGGTPVASGLAQSRADICTGIKNGNPCPNNQLGLVPVEAAAGAIKRHVESKNDFKLTVNGEENLHTCKACWCPLALKVHVPASFLHVSPETRTKIQQTKPDCWLLKENSA